MSWLQDYTNRMINMAVHSILYTCMDVRLANVDNYEINLGILCTFHGYWIVVRITKLSKIGKMSDQLLKEVSNLLIGKKILIKNGIFTQRRKIGGIFKISQLILMMQYWFSEDKSVLY